jgi:hypothetical protein
MHKRKFLIINSSRDIDRNKLAEAYDDSKDENGHLKIEIEKVKVH